MVDLYELLQVHPRADADVIRAAFRALARKHHPDAGGDPRRMMALTDAWRVLGDRRSRARYDAARAVQLATMANAAATVQSGAGSRVATAASPVASTPYPPASAGAAPPEEGAFRAPARTAADGTVLDFGRYAGWSIRELALRDPDYLEWLKRTSIGRRLTSEIELQLAALDTRSQAPSRPAQVPRFRRPIFGRA